MSKKSSAKNIDKAAIAMVGFGVLICGLSVFFHLYWFLVFGIIWILLPVLFTKENNDEDEQD